MKKQLKNTKKLLLRYSAIRVLNRFYPDVIAVTGSIGKTSAKDAIYEAIAPDFNTRKSIGNANEEIGVPSTIIGARTLKNIPDVLNKVFFSKEYPKVLVLEMGADRFGDIKYLTSFVKPKIAVVTRVANSHVEYFGSLENIAKEKGTIVENLGKNDFAILNYDDELVREMSKRTKAKTIFYGLNSKADLSASEIKTTRNGLDFIVSYEKEKTKCHLDVIGRHQIYSALAGIACALALGINFQKAVKNVENYKLPKDRTNVINGKKNTVIISDIYNANPESMLAGFETFNDFYKNIKASSRRVFIIGDMRELGVESEKFHLEIGKKMFDFADYFVLVGEEMKNVFEKYKERGNILWFENSKDAAKKIDEIIKKDDIIFIKASHGIQMENILNKIK